MTPSSIASPASRGALALVAAALCSTTASAADLPGPGDKVLPCRPTVACTAEISAPGQLESEAGLQHKVTSGGRADSAPLLFKLSLTDNFQLQVGTPGPTLLSGDGSSSYLEASQVLGKVAFQLREGTTVGATAALNLPTASGIEKRTDGLFALLGSQDLLGFHADLNLGLNVLGLGQPGKAAQGWAALSVSHELPLDLTGMVEGWHSTAGGDYTGKDTGFLFALGWSPTSWICVDVGGDVALFGSDRRFSAFVGVTFVPVDLWGGPQRRARAEADKRGEALKLAEASLAPKQ
jgi:hypothetical protein